MEPRRESSSRPTLGIALPAQGKYCGMLVVLSLLGAIAVGAGWVVEERVIDADMGGDPGQRLMALLHRPMWWSGIASMSVGQTLIGFALQKGAITLVAPLASTSLLWAFLIRGVLI